MGKRCAKKRKKSYLLYYVIDRDLYNSKPFLPISFFGNFYTLFLHHFPDIWQILEKTYLLHADVCLSGFRHVFQKGFEKKIIAFLRIAYKIYHA